MEISYLLSIHHRTFDLKFMARFQAVTYNHFKSFHDLILGRDFSKGIKSDPAN
jgi:hypothetical protein